MPKVPVAVLMGGPSREHDVSLKSGRAVCQALPTDKYDVQEVEITMLGAWKINGGKPVSATEALKVLKEKGVTIVFLALHGSFGEDGTVQALLDHMDMKYTGSGVAASLLAMDKIVSAEIFTSAGFTTPKSLSFTRYEMVQEATLLDSIRHFKLPLIVKPARQGSSVGVTLVSNDEDLMQAINFALEHDNQIIVQEYIDGREVSCGVLRVPATGKLGALPPTELKPVGVDFFDYYAKYTPGATEEITPPDMPAKLIERIQANAVKAHELLGCEGYSRTDMIVKGSDIYVIETNTLPGMTETSILPQQAAAVGMTFAELIERIITNAVE